MELSVIAGIIGSIVLLIGAAWPLEKVQSPTKSVRNRMFAIGSFIMLAYAILGYLGGGSMFYIVLELVVMFAVVLMFMGTEERLSTGLISVAGILLMVRSWILFQGPAMILFILAFIVLGLGYVYKTNTARKFLFLAIGGALIVLYSYLNANQISLRMNIFFSLFSLFYAIKIILRNKKPLAKITKPAPAKILAKKVVKKVIKKKPVAKKK